MPDSTHEKIDERIDSAEYTKIIAKIGGGNYKLYIENIWIIYKSKLKNYYILYIYILFTLIIKQLYFAF